jgi:hypothetical protein
MILRRSPARLTAALACTAVTAGFGFAGCGSSKSSSSTNSAAPATTTSAPASLTKAQFLAKGNAICKHGNALTQAANMKLGANPTRAQITTYVRKVFGPIVQAQINAVRALSASTADHAKIGAMLDLAQADLNTAETNPALLGGGTNVFANFAKEAHAYGLTQCAKKA